MNPMNCSLVIRAYNEGKHIERLLEGILQQTLTDVEIILVDSGSTDDTVAIAESYHARIVRIAPQDFTFGRSLNLGIRSASRELVVIASAHVYPVYPDWLEQLLEAFNDSKIALTYGKQRGTPNPAALQRIFWNRQQEKLAPQTKFSEHEIFAHWFPENSNLKQTNPFCNNANAAIRRSVWEGHSYDETLTGLEDLDWAKWAQANGHEIAYIAPAEVIHVHNETPTGVFNRYRREAMAFKKIYPEAHFNLYDFAWSISSNIINDLWHATRQRQLLSSFASIFWFRWNQFIGTRAGYRQSVEWNWQLRQTFYYPRGTEISPTLKREIEPIRYSNRAYVSKP